MCDHDTGSSAVGTTVRAGVRVCARSFSDQHHLTGIQRWRSDMFQGARTCPSIAAAVHTHCRPHNLVCIQRGVLTRT